MNVLSHEVISWCNSISSVTCHLGVELQHNIHTEHWGFRCAACCSSVTTISTEVHKGHGVVLAEVVLSR